MPQSLDNLIRHLKPYWLDSAAATAAIELNKIILFPSGTVPAVFYPKTAAGLAAAVAAAAAGDIIWIPPATIGGNYTIPAGVEVVGVGDDNTNLSGIITNNGSLSGLNVTGTLTNNANLQYIIDPSGYTQSTRWLGLKILPRVGFHLDEPVVNATLRASALLAATASVQLYARNGANYSGWALVRETDNSFKINWDATEGVETQNLMQFYTNHIDPKQDVIMPNDIALRWYESGGTARNVLVLDILNNIIIGVDGSNAAVYIERLNTSTAINTKYSSRYFHLMANYWNGGQIQRTVRFQNVLDTAGAAPKNHLEINIGTEAAPDNIVSLYNDNGTLYTVFQGPVHAQDIKVSSNDTTPGYLNGKLVAGTYVTLTENNDGANETLTVDVNTGALPTHSAVTLDADAATILDLQGVGGQEIGLDVQNANTVFAGPTTGAANEPTFRALVAADLPAATSINMPYGSFSSSATQTIANTTLAYAITYTDREVTNQITLTANSKINILVAGTYLITFSAVGKSGLANKTLDIWLAVDGTNVPRSNTVSKFVGAANERIITVTYIYDFTAGQYFELYMHSDDTNTTLTATAAGINPTRPACPSIIVTVNKISDSNSDSYLLMETGDRLLLETGDKIYLE